jgi:dipeptidyl aminopeptidase/acylaminoacyl peptidase
VLVPVEGGEERVIGPEGGVVGLWSFSPDGRQIIYTGDTKPTAQTDFFVYDRASGETRRLTDDLQVLPSSGDVMGGAPAAPVWLDERQVLFHAARGGASGLYVIDSAGGGVEPVVKWRALHAGLSVDRERRYAAQVFHDDSHLGEVSVYDLQTNTQQVITNFSGPVLADTPSAKAERFEIERGGRTIEAWLLHPPDFDASKTYPLIMDIHGGPHGHYGFGFYPWQQVLATNGFLVVYANPRGSGSYGRAFGEDVVEDWGGEDYQDLLAVVDEVLKRPYADATRTGIRGYSYGGYMTSWMIGQTDRFQACVCGAPCFDFESFWGTSDIGHIFGEREFGGRPHAQREAYAKHSPSEFAHRAVTPTLIVHGEADERCPIGQGEELFVALTKAGCKTEFARYPGADHLFLIHGWPEHRADYWRRELAWFKEHFGEPA